MKKKFRPKPKPVRRIIVYCRVSTDDQKDRGISLEAQEAKGRGYVQLHDLELYPEILRDAATGKTLDRPGLQTALRLLREGAADGIVVAKLDRLARKLSIWSELLDNYFSAQHPWTLLSVADHIDTQTATGRFMLNITMSVSQWERETISERTIDALAFLASQGVVLGGNPLGAHREKRVEDGPAGAFIEIPHEAAIVRRARTLKKMGHTVREIAELFNDEKVPTKRGGAWWPTTIQRIVSRPA